MSRVNADQRAEGALHVVRKTEWQALRIAVSFSVATPVLPPQAHEQSGCGVGPEAKQKLKDMDSPSPELIRPMLLVSASSSKSRDSH